MQLPKFGSVEEVTVNPDNSSIGVEVVYVNGELKPGKYKHYKYRVRVSNSQEEKAEYGLFLMEKQGMLNSSFHTERTKDGDEKGFYYVVKVWTEKLD